MKLVKVSDPAQAISEVENFKGAAMVDGLFGIGLNRALSGDWARLIEAVNKRKGDTLIVAVDTPSGLDGDSGDALGGVSVKADITVTFGSCKKGMLLP